MYLICIIKDASRFVVLLTLHFAILLQAVHIKIGYVFERSQLDSCIVWTWGTVVMDMYI